MTHTTTCAAAALMLFSLSVATPSAHATLSGDLTQLVFEVEATNQPACFSLGTLERFYFHSPDARSSAQYWKNQSLGAVRLTGDVVAVFLDYDMSDLDCGDGHTRQQWRTDAKYAARLQGLEPDDYDLLAYAWPVACTPRGAASGNRHYISRWADARLAAHETGHNLGGNGHSKALVDGELDQYGGLGVMGHSWSDLNALPRAGKGWIDDARVEVISGDGTYTLAPLHTDDDRAPQILRWGSTFGQGVPIIALSTRIARGPYNSDLVAPDTNTLHVEKSTVLYARLEEGQSYMDSDYGMLIDNIAFVGGLLTFDISFPGECTPQPPALASMGGAVIAGVAPITVPLRLFNNDAASLCEGEAYMEVASATRGITVELTEPVAVEPGGFTDTEVLVTVHPKMAEGTYEVSLFADHTDEGLTSEEETLVLTVDHTPPPSPTNLNAQVTAPDTVQLSWTTAWWDDQTVAYENVYRNGVLVTPVSIGMGWTDTAPPAGRIHYEVTAIDMAGNESDPSNVFSVFVHN